MATTVSTIWIRPGVRMVTWAALGNAENGDAVELADFPDKTVIITGTFGGATVTLQVSNDNTNWLTATDIASTAITATTAEVNIIGSNARYMRAITAGGAGTSVSVSIVCTKGRA